MYQLILYRLNNYYCPEYFDNACTVKEIVDDVGEYPFCKKLTISGCGQCGLFLIDDLYVGISCTDTHITFYYIKNWYIHGITVRIVIPKRFALARVVLGTSAISIMDKNTIPNNSRLICEFIFNIKTKRIVAINRQPQIHNAGLYERMKSGRIGNSRHVTSNPHSMIYSNMNTPPQDERKKYIGACVHVSIHTKCDKYYDCATGALVDIKYYIISRRPSILDNMPADIRFLFK